MSPLPKPALGKCAENEACGTGTPGILILPVLTPTRTAAKGRLIMLLRSQDVVWFGLVHLLSCTVDWVRMGNGNSLKLWGSEIAHHIAGVYKLIPGLLPRSHRRWAFMVRRQRRGCDSPADCIIKGLIEVFRQNRSAANRSRRCLRAIRSRSFDAPLTDEQRTAIESYLALQ
jgi:hypothetical protein